MPCGPDVDSCLTCLLKTRSGASLLAIPYAVRGGERVLVVVMVGRPWSMVTW